MRSAGHNSHHSIKTLVTEDAPLIGDTGAGSGSYLLPSPSILSWFSVNIGVITRTLLVLIAIALFTSAATVRGKTSVVDLVVLGIVCFVVIWCSASPLLSWMFSKNASCLRGLGDSLEKHMKVVASPKVSMGAMVAVIAVMAAITFALPEDATSTRLSRAQSLLGLVVFILVLWATSNSRANISWRTVWVGILMQFLLALFVLRTWFGYNLFKFLSDLISSYLGFSEAGYEFLFGSKPSNFAGNVFPAIIFFCATVELLYYVGVVQVIVRKFATFFLYLMGTSGAESVVAAASPFLGQGENAVLVRPFIKDMTKSELHQVMTSGFATIAGSVLFGYISLGVSPQYLITAAIMSVPCAISLSKLRYPELDTPTTQGEVKDIEQDENHKASNALHALGNGAKTGIQIVLIIAAALIAILSLVAALDAILTWIGRFFFIESLTVQKVVSYPFYPVTWLLGVPWSDVSSASQLLALKLTVNEFAAYSELISMKDTLSERTQIIITFALCGFANFSSVGIQIGILGAIAPSRLNDISSLAMSAMLTGALSTCFGALTAGMLF
jgi:CNT family concentrative nucleoside transporter